MLAARGWVTDGGLETDLIFNRGIDLPDFAAFPLLDDADGRQVLTDYFLGYAEVAARVGRPLLLETPTWRANTAWGARLGYDEAAVARINEQSVEFLRRMAEPLAATVPEVQVGGVLGPRGDGYVPGAGTTPEEAAAYHRPQLAAFAAAGADRATVLTITDVSEAIGVAMAAADLGLPVAIGFTVETDGRLPGGEHLGEAIAAVDAVTRPAYFVVNCAHPDHVMRGLGGDGAWRDRIQGLRVNASRLSHAELDESEELDDGDVDELASDVALLLAGLPHVQVLGGCCGTDVRHVSRMWDVVAGQPSSASSSST